MISDMDGVVGSINRFQRTRSVGEVESRIMNSPAAVTEREYLNRLNSFSLAAADHFLAQWGTRWWTKEIATSERFERHRGDWGFPQPGDRGRRA